MSREEASFLREYRPGDFPRPSVTVDIVALCIVDGELRVLLVRRGEHPYKGAWALPGGFVRVGDGHRDKGEDLIVGSTRRLPGRTTSRRRSAPRWKGHVSFVHLRWPNSPREAGQTTSTIHGRAWPSRTSARRTPRAGSCRTREFRTWSS